MPSRAFPVFELETVLAWTQLVLADAIYQSPEAAAQDTERHDVKDAIRSTGRNTYGIAQACLAWFLQDLCCFRGLYEL